MTYTITKLNEKNRHITVKFSVDDKEQTMCDAPFDSAESLDAFLVAYGIRYEANILSERAKAESNAIPAEITAMIGLSKNVELVDPEIISMAEAKAAIEKPKIKTEIKTEMLPQKKKPAPMKPNPNK